MILYLLSKVLRSYLLLPFQIYEMEFMIDNSNLGFLVSEADGNLVMFMYQPHARESYGGKLFYYLLDLRL